MNDLNIIETYRANIETLKGQYRTLDGMVTGDIRDLTTFDEIQNLSYPMISPLKAPVMKNLKCVLAVSLIFLLAVATGLVFFGIVDFKIFQPSANSIIESIELQQKIGFWYEWLQPALLTFMMLCLICSVPLYFIFDNLAKNLDQSLNKLHLTTQNNANLKAVSFDISKRMSMLNMKGLELILEIEKVISQTSIEDDKAQLMALKSDLERSALIYSNVNYLILKKLNT